jgi:hypothetical protein
MMIHLEKQTILTADEVVRLQRSLPDPASPTTPDTIICKPEGSRSDFTFTKVRVVTDTATFTDPAGNPVEAGEWVWVFSGPTVFPR